jgi:hypothetical protein
MKLIVALKNIFPHRKQVASPLQEPIDYGFIAKNASSIPECDEKKEIL